MKAVDNTWYILGPGAIGCLWASYWRTDNTRVVLIEHSPIDSNSVQLSSDQGCHSYPIETVSPEQLLHSNTIIQHLFISTKAQHTLAALTQLQPRLATNAEILVVQNGLAIVELQQLLATQQLFAGVTTDGAYRTAPLQVTHAGRGETLVGAMTNHATAAVLSRLPGTGLAIAHCDTIEQRLWQKFALNCAINPLTVKYQCRNGQLLTQAEARKELSLLCREIQSIASAIKPAAWFETLEADVVKVLELTADNINSMLQDVQQGRDTEIAQLNSWLVQQAKQLAIPHPLNQAIINTVLAHHPAA